MSFILWLILLVGGFVLRAQSPEPFDGAHLAGGIMVAVAVAMFAVAAAATLLLFASFWKKTNNDIRSGFSSEPRRVRGRKLY